MTTHEVTLLANEGIFRGLAKQNMLFHQCIGELVDNAIAAKRDEEKFHVQVILSRKDSHIVDVYVVDNCKGMTLDLFCRGLQLGESATSENRLNEHGFGLKNALASLSGGNGFWKVWTSPINETAVYTTEGPFRPEMYIKDDESFPEVDFLPTTDISTLIKVPVTLSFVQTVQGRGSPARDLAALRQWLVEHLGVLYRGYLEQDAETCESAGSITVSVERDRLRVPPVQVPLGNMSTQYMDVEIGGDVHTLEYRYGTLDEVKRDALVRGEKAKFYYQGNIPTQGIDIRLGKRVIATRQFETLWMTKDGDGPLSRHNNYNDFLGELLIPELPRGVLTTVNNKTDFNLDDPDWPAIFARLNEIRPIEAIREKSEAALRRKWMQMLSATNPDDTVSDERAIWPTGTRIDVYRKTAAGKVIIYEIKVGSGQPMHLYQLKMYWDGLVLAGEEPKEAVLLVQDFGTSLEEMANLMNQGLTPPAGGEPYDFKIEKHEDKGL